MLCHFQSIFAEQFLNRSTFLIVLMATKLTHQFSSCFITSTLTSTLNLSFSRKKKKSWRVYNQSLQHFKIMCWKITVYPRWDRQTKAVEYYQIWYKWWRAELENIFLLNRMLCGWEMHCECKWRVNLSGFNNK